MAIDPWAELVARPPAITVRAGPGAMPLAVSGWYRPGVTLVDTVGWDRFRVNPLAGDGSLKLGDPPVAPKDWPGFGAALLVSKG